MSNVTPEQFRGVFAAELAKLPEVIALAQAVDAFVAKFDDQTALRTDISDQIRPTSWDEAEQIDDQLSVATGARATYEIITWACQRIANLGGASPFPQRNDQSLDFLIFKSLYDVDRATWPANVPEELLQQKDSVS